MIIGKNKDAVINNIQKAVQEKEYNKKVEVDDPNLTKEQKEELVENFLKNKDTVKYKFNNKIARAITKVGAINQDFETAVVGIEKIKNIKTGAIVTSNHFNPLDNLVVRKFARKAHKRRLYIVSQETNLAMGGFVGFMMNYSDIVPISNQLGYIKKDFPKMITDLLKDNNYILIYPEQEMWFNYRKPRPPKPGAYFYAAKNNVPIISCFVEMIDRKKSENDEFYKIKYIIHVLAPIYPDKNLSPKENSRIMMKKDYEQKKEAYEKAYGKKLTYDFDYSDIAGLKNEDKK